MSVRHAFLLSRHSNISRIVIYTSVKEYHIFTVLVCRANMDFDSNRLPIVFSHNGAANDLGRC